jgi:hypothetical protein
LNNVDVNNVNVNSMNKNIELIGARAQEVKIRSEMPPHEVEKVKNKVKVGVLAELAMLDVISEGDIVNTPRLNKTHQEEGEDERKVKKVRLDKVKTTDQIDNDSDIIWFVQEIGDTLEKAKIKRVTGDAFDNEDTGENEDDDDSKNSETAHDPENFGVTREEAEVKWVIRNAVDDGESIEEGDAEWLSGDKIKNISEEEAGFEDASEDAFDDEDTGEDESRTLKLHKWVIRNAVDDGDMMKQDEAPKNGEDIKKELTSAADIRDAPGAKTELREGVVEAKSDEDKGEEDSTEDTADTVRYITTT